MKNVIRQKLKVEVEIRSVYKIHDKMWVMEMDLLIIKLRF